MPDKDRWQQISELNQNLLNQEAKRWLRLAQQQPDHDNSLYVFQLALWGLEQKSLQFKSQDRTNQLQDFLVGLQGEDDQEAALEYLVLSDDPDPEAQPAVDEWNLQLQRVPEDAAWVLINQLDSKLSSDPTMRGIYPPDQLLASQPD